MGFAWMAVGVMRPELPGFDFSDGLSSQNVPAAAVAARVYLNPPVVFLGKLVRAGIADSTHPNGVGNETLLGRGLPRPRAESGPKS